MPKPPKPPKPPSSADTTSTVPPVAGSHLEGAAMTLGSVLPQYLPASELAKLAQVSKTSQQITADALKKQALEKLLYAVAFGDEALARKIISSLPELILNSKATVKDISGKEIKRLTPLQAAICALDVDMVRMIFDVLQHKLETGVKLSFEPELEIARQITSIYSNGLDSEQAAQIAKAQEFKTQTENGFNLNWIFAKINAAEAAHVEAELTNPGQHTDSELNAALHYFRQQFATANQEPIFNPFYLLKALEFYDEKFANFSGTEDEKWAKRELFCIQIIGFTQRYLPACFLQAFAQGYPREDRKKLERNFKFKNGEAYMRPIESDVDGLGFRYCAEWGEAKGRGWAYVVRSVLSGYQNLLLTKKLDLEQLFTAPTAPTASTASTGRTRPLAQ